MVRIAKDLLEDGGEPPKKKVGHLKKKNPSSGVWPCKINGCNKQFAREADLKRHQRTTKQHSQPGFACPQCDATFTRTDALRRHQKSRHNGVIIEPSDDGKKDGQEAGPSAIKSRSRSGSKDKDGVMTASNGVDTSGSATISNHYRQHTAAGASLVPGIGGIPTSATRNWPPPPPWATEAPAPPPMASMAYNPMQGGPPPSTFYPTPYYRTNGVPPLHPMGHPQMGEMPMGAPHPPDQPQGSTSAGNGTPITTEHNQNRDVEMVNGTPPSEPKHNPVIDPSLDSAQHIDPSLQSAGGAEAVPTSTEDLGMSDQIHQALESVKSALAEVQQKAMADASKRTTSFEGNADESDTHVLSDADANGEPDDSIVPESKIDNGSNTADSDALVQLMNEQGEPILNPAELLAHLLATTPS